MKLKQKQIDQEQPIYTNVEAAALVAPSTGILIYRKVDGLWYEKNSAGTESVVNVGLGNIRPIVFSKPEITVHLNAIGNTFTEAVNTSISLPLNSDYLLTLSFNFNGDATGSDVVVRATWNGNTLDLNDRSADPQGNLQILRQESKDIANGPGGAITGTGTGQKYAYTMQFPLKNQIAGTKNLTLEVGSEGANIESSIWNIIAKFEIVNII